MTGQNAIERVSRGAAGAWRFVNRIPNRVRIALRDMQDARGGADCKCQSASMRHDDLVAFYAKYEDLVEVLCDSAQYGPDGRLDARYLDLRGWMMGNYPQIRGHVAAFLKYDTKDAQQSLDWHGLAGDAFEALFAAPSISEFLRLDDGQMIFRIERTRNALNLYGEHLRELAAQEKECA